MFALTHLSKKRIWIRSQTLTAAAFMKIVNRPLPTKWLYVPHHQHCAFLPCIFYFYPSWPCSKIPDSNLRRSERSSLYFAILGLILHALILLGISVAVSFLSLWLNISHHYILWSFMPPSRLSIWVCCVWLRSFWTFRWLQFHFASVSLSAYTYYFLCLWSKHLTHRRFDLLTLKFSS